MARVKQTTKVSTSRPTTATKALKMIAHAKKRAARETINGARRVAAASTRRRTRPLGRAVRQIKDLQKTTHALVPKARMQRLIREILQDIPSSKRITKEATEVLHIAAEDVLVNAFVEVELMTRAGGRNERPRRATPEMLRLAKRLVPGLGECV